MSVPDGTKTHLAHHQQQAARCTLHFYQYTRNHAGHAYNISVRVAQKGWPAGSWHVKLAEHKYIHWIDRQDQKKRSKKNKTRKIVRDLPNKISVSKLLICRLRSTKSSFDFSSVHNGSKLRFKHFVVPFTIPLIHPSPDTQKTEKKTKFKIRQSLRSGSRRKTPIPTAESMLEHKTLPCRLLLLVCVVWKS